MPDDIKPVDEPTITIDETEAGTEAEEFSIEGLTDAEVGLAKKHGLVKEEATVEIVEEKKPDGTDDKQPEPKGEDKPTEPKEVESPTFEQVEADEKLVDKYGKNEKALYWKWKTDKHKRQEAQSRAKELEEKLKDAVDSGISGQKLKKIEDLLKNPDSLTIEALQSVLGEKIEPEKKANELDNAQAIQQKVAVKAQFAEKIGSSKYDKFNEISNLAKEVIQADASKTYQKLIDESFLNDDVDENMLVERVVSIARMSPKYNEVINRVDPEKKATAERVIANAGKKTSSASVTGASGKRVISESELTPEQAVRLSAEQYARLKPETRRRLLQESNR